MAVQAPPPYLTILGVAHIQNVAGVLLNSGKILLKIPKIFMNLEIGFWCSAFYEIDPRAEIHQSRECKIKLRE